MSKGEYVIVPKGTKFTGAGKLGLRDVLTQLLFLNQNFVTILNMNMYPIITIIYNSP